MNFNNDPKGSGVGTSHLILVSTALILGVGHNIPRASTLVIIDSLDKRSDEQQTAGRIQRIGQEDPDNKVYVFRTKNSYVDQNILKRHEIRQDLIDNSTAKIQKTGPREC
jgi:superfamily II DNA or RNA helicase